MTVVYLPVLAAPARLDPGARVYAVGDVHGCADRLEELHGAIARDLAESPVARPTLVHLGDYVDRGPDSAGVVALLVAPRTVAHIPTVNLMGNHERTMLDALDGQRAAATDWMHGGGRETLASYGIDPDSPRKGWLAQVPPAHLAFLRGLALQWRIGPYLFVHAGVRPGVALADQASEDLLNIRARFLTSEEDFGAVVVHGHTPRQLPVVRANRIGIDTRAALGGALTCAVLEADRVRFIQT